MALGHAYPAALAELTSKRLAAWCRDAPVLTARPPVDADRRTGLRTSALSFADKCISSFGWRFSRTIPK